MSAKQIDTERKTCGRHDNHIIIAVFRKETELEEILIRNGTVANGPCDNTKIASDRHLLVYTMFTETDGYEDQRRKISLFNYYIRYS